MVLRSGLVVCLCCAAALATGFDTAPHSNITREACFDYGFSDYARKVVQLQNWYVDFYSNDPTFGDAHKVDKLHFDNLDTTRKVKHYWSKFTSNAKAAFEAAATANDRLQALTLLGITLHAVQDFYTHSNWVELHPEVGNAYRQETYFMDIPADNPSTLYTGRYPTDNAINAGNALTYHGNYTYGLNHDCRVRPRFSASYVFGYAASVQWIEAVKGWVNAQRDGFFDAMKNYNDTATSASLEEDLSYSYRISKWLVVPGNAPAPGFDIAIDGKWNGPGSGRGVLGAWVAAQFITFRSVFSLRFTESKDFLPLVTNLYEFPAANEEIPAPPAMPNTQVDKRVIFLRTTSVADVNGTETLDPWYSPIDRDNLADLYGYISIDNFWYTEPTFVGKASGNPEWVTLGIVPSGQTDVAIVYGLYDEDAIAGLQDDDHCDIKIGAGKDLNFSFKVATHRLSGDIIGIHDTFATRASSTGDVSKIATVTFFVTEYPIAPVGVAGGGKKLVFDTDHPKPLYFNGDFVLLGLTSGRFETSNSPERWCAVPFTIPTGGALIDEMDVYWFANSTLTCAEIKYIIWQRFGQSAPGAIVYQGTLGPSYLDVDPEYGDGRVDPFWAYSLPMLHTYRNLNISLPGGTYYLTVYGSGQLDPFNPTPNQGIAWVTGAAGERLSENKAFLWRSTSYPVGGFQPWAPASVQPWEFMGDPREVWNPAFRMRGTTSAGPATISGDTEFRGWQGPAHSLDYIWRTPLWDAGGTIFAYRYPTTLENGSRYWPYTLHSPWGAGNGVTAVLGERPWLKRTLRFADDGTHRIFDFIFYAGDIDGDGEIGIGDYALFSHAFGSEPGDTNWDPFSDLNGDGSIDIGDFGIFSGNFGMIGD